VKRGAQNTLAHDAPIKKSGEATGLLWIERIRRHQGADPHGQGHQIQHPRAVRGHQREHTALRFGRDHPVTPSTR